MQIAGCLGGGWKHCGSNGHSLPQDPCRIVGNEAHAVHQCRAKLARLDSFRGELRRGRYETDAALYQRHTWSVGTDGYFLAWRDATEIDL